MEEDGIQLPIIAVNLVTANIPYSSNVLDNIHQASAEIGFQFTLKVLMHYIKIGWPCEQRMLPQELHLYLDGLVNKGCFHKSYICTGISGMIIC